jgi:hypothetical protein
MPTQAGKPGTGVWAGMSNDNSSVATVPSKPMSAAEQEASTMQATFVRTGTAIQHPPGGLATPAPTVGALSIGGINPGANTAVGGSTMQAGPGDLSLLTKPPPNRAPLVVGLLAVVALGAAGTWYAMNRGPGPDVLVPPPPIVKDPVVVKDPDPPPEVKPPPPEVKTPTALEAEMTALRARDTLARARTEFNQGNLEATALLLADVPVGTTFRTEADDMQKKIDDINDKVGKGKKAFAAGNCESAVGFYQQALKLNPRVAAANEGLRGCKNAAVPTTFDP